MRLIKDIKYLQSKHHAHARTLSYRTAHATQAISTAHFKWVRAMPRTPCVSSELVCVCVYFLAGEFHAHDVRMLDSQRLAIRKAFEPDSPPDRSNAVVIAIGSRNSGIRSPTDAGRWWSSRSSASFVSSHVALQPGEQVHAFRCMVLWAQFHQKQTLHSSAHHRANIRYHATVRHPHAERCPAEVRLDERPNAAQCAGVGRCGRDDHHVDHLVCLGAGVRGATG